MLKEGGTNCLAVEIKQEKSYLKNVIFVVVFVVVLYIILT
jgi:hypothetical protein